MSFETFKCFAEDMRKLEQDLRFRVAIQKAHTRQGRDFCLMRSYADAALVEQHFTADSDANEQFVFVKRRSTDTEQVFTLRGTLSEVALPPVRKPLAGRPIHTGALYQYIKLTSYKSDTAFLDSAKGIDNVLDLLAEAVPDHVDRRVIITPSGRVPFLSFKTPLLSSPHRVHPSDLIPIPDGIDPKNVLADGIQNGHFVMAEDNRVEYARLTKDDDGEWHCTRGVTPTIFRPGTIVEAGVVLRLLKLRDRSYKILFHLHSLSAVAEDGPKILKDIRSKSKFHTPLPFPRKDTVFEGDNDIIDDVDDSGEDADISEEGSVDISMEIDEPPTSEFLVNYWNLNVPAYHLEVVPDN